MGGIRAVGLGVDCDRCGRTVPIAEKEETDFYTQFSSRDNRDDHMFVALLCRTDGTTTGVDFEYLCPRCAETVFGALAKLDKKLEPEAVEPEPVAEKTNPGVKKPAEKKATPVKEPVEKKAVPAKTAKPEAAKEEVGKEFTDKDIFGDY